MGKTRTPTEEYDAIVVGAGVAGLYALHRLREMGKKVIAVETGNGVGGTWYWNRYPGARVDSQCHVYNYWFSDELLAEWGWSEVFPAQPETERYLNFAADKFDLKKDIRFNTRVDQARYDEAKKIWHVTTDKGDKVNTRYFICCTGLLSAPIVPFPGKEKFNGMICHTARWPRESVDFTGKRVGVVGTGATGIQVIQTVAPLCRHLKVFQRTPQYTLAMSNPKLTDEAREAFRKRYPALKKRVHQTFTGHDYDFDERPFNDYSPEQRREIYETLLAEGSLSLWIGSFYETLTDEKASEEISGFVREKMRARIKNAALAAKLIPTTYGFGTRRVPLDTGYLETFERDNVELVDVKDNPIARITEKGLLLANGEEHELDVLILATGFDGGSGAMARIDIRGRDDQSLKAKWDKDIRTTLGLQIHGFPNLFATGAPLAPSAAFCNMTTCLQQQVDWITDTIAYMGEHGYDSIEPTAEKEDAWVRHHDEVANTTLIAKTDSWYTGTNVAGKQRRVISYVGGNPVYEKACDEIRESGYQGFEVA